MKRTLLLALASIFFCVHAYAKHEGMCGGYKKGGFYDTDTPPVSVAEVQKMTDGRYVTMQGYITKRVGEDKYHFSDGKNEMIVEIDGKIWQGQFVSPKDKVMISGKVDKEDGNQTVDVKSLMLMPQS